MDKKKCTKCQVLKDITNYHREGKSLRPNCKECVRNYYLENKDKFVKVNCDICEKSIVETYLKKHKNDLHENLREKIKCECGKMVYNLNQHLTKNIHKKLLLKI